MKFFFFYNSHRLELSISPVQLNNPKPLEKLAEIWSGFSQFWECIVVFLPISSVVYLCDWDARWLAVTDPKVISWISAVKQIGGLRPNRIKRDWPCARAVMKSGSTQTVAGQCIWGIIIQNSNALSEGNLEKDREERWDLALRCQVKRKILQLSILLLLRILHVGALDLFSTVVTMNEFMGLHPPLLPDSPRDQRKVFSRWLIKVRGVACGWEDSATEFIISVPLIRSEFNSTHATKRGQGCGVTTVTVALANSSVCHSMTVGMKWLFSMLDSVSVRVWTTCDLSVTPECGFQPYLVHNLQKWWCIPVLGGLQCPSGIARQSLGLQGGTFLRDSPG